MRVILQIKEGPAYKSCTNCILSSHGVEPKFCENIYNLLLSQDETFVRNNIGNRLDKKKIKNKGNKNFGFYVLRVTHEPKNVNPCT
jgi:hypothetical protein